MQQATKPHIVTASDEQQTRIHGRYTVSLSLPVDGGFSIAVFAGPHRISELCFSSFDPDAANLIYRVIAEGGEKGVAPEGIRAAIRDALTRAVDSSTPGSRKNAELQRLINTIPAQLEQPTDRPRTFADLAAHGRRPQVPRSRSGVEFKPLSAAMRRALTTHIDGRLYPGDGVSRATLRAIARKGLGILEFCDCPRGRIRCLVLNQLGREAAGKAVA